jgi:hypothetical protein
MDNAFRLLFSLQRGTPCHGQWVVECLRGSWDRIVGRKLAAVCRPEALKGSVLRVQVMDPEWIHTIKGLRAEIQEKLRSETCGEVNTLVLLSKAEPK